MKSFLFASVLSLAFCIQSAQAAGFKSTISFDDREKAEHMATLDVLLKSSGNCMQNTLTQHQKFFARYGISPFWGSNTEFHKLDEAGKRGYLRSLGLNPKILAEMRQMSCVRAVIQCLAEGFKTAKQDAQWAKVRKFVTENGSGGLAIQEALRALGWKVMYWNPAPARNREFDAYERRNDPNDLGHNWGYHEDRYNQVMSRGRYLYNTVDDASLFVNFGTSPSRALREVPFAVGTGHGGYHVFSVVNANVIEAHSMRNINDRTLVEKAPFNPMARGGGPNGLFRSGLFAVPPTYIR